MRCSRRRGFLLLASGLFTCPPGLLPPGLVTGACGTHLGAGEGGGEYADWVMDMR